MQIRVSRALLPVLLLASSASPQTAYLTDPKPTTGDDTVTAADGEQSNAVIAAGGSGHLVVWTDLRTAPESTFGGSQGDMDVYAARLDAQGALLDPIPIVVSDEFGTQTSPRAAWNGSYWLVTWINQSATQFFYASEVRGVRIAPDGQVLDDPPLALVTYQSSSSVSYALTANGTEWLVVSRGSSSGPETDLVGRRVDSNGTLIEAAPAVLQSGGSTLMFGLDVESAGGQYLVVYELSGNLVGRRYGSDLSFLGTVPSIPGTTLGSNGSQYYFVWSSGQSYVGSPMTPAGTLVLPSGRLLTAAPSVVNLSGHGITWDGGQWWIAWHHALDGLEATRVASNGFVLDPQGVPLDPAAEEFVRSVAAAGTPGGGLRIAWQDDRAGGATPSDIRIGGYAGDMTLLGQEIVSTGLPSHSAPDLAAGLDGFLSVYKSSASQTSRILTQRLDVHGNAIAPPVEVASGTSLSTGDVAWNGTHYLVVWADNGQVMALRMAATGAPADPAPFPVMNGYSTDVAALGSEFLVGALYQSTSLQFIHPYVKRVDASGAVLDAAPIQLGQYFARNMRISTAGGRWLATWQRNYSHDDPAAEIRACFIAPDGSTSGDFNVGFGGQPAAAASTGTVLFVWRSGTDSSSAPDIVGRRMLTDGTLLGTSSGFQVAAAPFEQRYPSIAWTGSHFLAVWEDQRTAQAFFDERTDVYGVRVNESGVVLDPAALPVFDLETPTRQPLVVHGHGRSIVASARFRSDDGAYRTTHRGIGAWDGLGLALAGSFGAPILDGYGQLAQGSAIELHVSRTLPATAGFHVLGFARLDAPFLGGILIPQPALARGFVTDAGGRSLVSLPIPKPIPSGVDLYVHSWILDPAGLQGFASTNGVRTTSL